MGRGAVVFLLLCEDNGLAGLLAFSIRLKLQIIEKFPSGSFARPVVLPSLGGGILSSFMIDRLFYWWKFHGSCRHFVLKWLKTTEYHSSCYLSSTEYSIPDIDRLEDQKVGQEHLRIEQKQKQLIIRSVEGECEANEHSTFLFITNSTTQNTRLQLIIQCVEAECEANEHSTFLFITNSTTQNTRLWWSH